MFAPSFFYIVQKCFQPLFSSMKRMFYRCCFTVPSFKNGKKSHFVPEIQDSTRFLPGLVESRISGLKNTFYSGISSVKRNSGTVKNGRIFNCEKSCTLSSTDVPKNPRPYALIRRINNGIMARSLLLCA